MRIRFNPGAFAARKEFRKPSTSIRGCGVSSWIGLKCKAKCSTALIWFGKKRSRSSSHGAVRSYRINLKGMWPRFLVAEYPVRDKLAIRKRP
jgi:hypothetical protein